MPISALTQLFDYLQLLVRGHKPKTVFLASKWLEREVRIDLYRHGWDSLQSPYRLLCVNDGQDLAQMQLSKMLAKLPRQFPLLVVGIHASAQRMQEYGTAARADFKGRGSRAGNYEHFVLEELLPYLENNFQLSTCGAQRAFVGFSLGGLAAFDLVWRNPQSFGRVGVFSGAFWWRATPFRERAPDADRIVHDTVERDGMRPGLRFWLQVGTQDENGDRNRNGIIDAVDDTLQLITLLKLQGYTPDDIHYEEVEGGTHDPKTWMKIFPQFLDWFIRNAKV